MNTADKWNLGFWDILPFVLSICCVIFLAAWYGELPNEVRIVFNTPGKNEEHMGSKMHLWTSPVVSTILAIAFTGLSRNIEPNHAKTGSQSTYKTLRWMFRSLASGIALIALSFTYFSVAETQGWPLIERRSVQPAAAVFFIFVPLIGMWKLFRAQRRDLPARERME